MENKKKQHQKSMTIDEQIKNLKELGLSFEDEEYAKKVLEDISYFRLIKAYSLGLKLKNKKYRKGITFEQIVELYLFNTKLRQLLFYEIEKVEIKLRCRLANYFAKKYGVIGYLEEKYFNNSEYHQKFLNDVYEEKLRSSKTPFVRNFKENYEGGELPIYALVEIISFGVLSKLYKNMLNPDKKEIAKSFGVGYTYLESWIESISCVRNICAHYGRLYNIKITKRPVLYDEYNKAKIKNDSVFGILLCLRYLLKTDYQWNMFVDKLEMLIEKYDNVKIDKMGFPSNWKELLEVR